MEQDESYNASLNLIEDEQPFYDLAVGYTSLAAWQKAREVKLFFHNEILPLLPHEEKFELAAQIRKASIGSTANIAEGYGRFHYQEGIQFYRFSRGSLYELKDHLYSYSDLKMIDKELFDKGIAFIENAKNALNGYIGYARKQKRAIKP